MRLIVGIIVGVQLIALSSVAFADSTEEAAQIFTRRCSGCHTYGKGIRVGPDLKGVTSRHPRAWLMQFIRSSQTVIGSGDASAVALFRQFKQQRMPDHELSTTQIQNLIDFLAAGGPERKPADERLAQTASAAQVEAGHQLFVGEKRFASGAQACAACHSIAGKQSGSGGTLGPDLTDAYLSYQDGALTSLIREGCFQRDDISKAHWLSAEEVFDLKAYLRTMAVTGVAHSVAANVSGGTAAVAASHPATGRRAQ